MNKARKAEFDKWNKNDCTRLVWIVGHWFWLIGYYCYHKVVYWWYCIPEDDYHSLALDRTRQQILHYWEVFKK
jgi:hypothetical protein